MLLRDCGRGNPSNITKAIRDCGSTIFRPSKNQTFSGLIQVQVVCVIRYQYSLFQIAIHRRGWMMVLSRITPNISDMLSLAHASDKPKVRRCTKDYSELTFSREAGPCSVRTYQE